LNQGTYSWLRKLPWARWVEWLKNLHCCFKKNLHCCFNTFALLFFFTTFLEECSYDVCK
jgi:hypothetical protein